MRYHYSPGDIMMGFRIRFGLIALLFLTQTSLADVVINEIHYNPPDINFEAGSNQEFIELYNPGPSEADLSGYTFTQGFEYTFPSGTKLAAGAYRVVARVPTYRTWRSLSPAPLGPFAGFLDNNGERITLAKPDGTVVDTVSYKDSPSWPWNADGYGSTMERIASDLPSEDWHSWRASLAAGGTPGRANSVAGTPPRPVLTSHEISPLHPTSQDTVTIRLGLDAPAQIQSATLHWENAAGGQTNPEMNIVVDARDPWRFFRGRSEPSSGLEWTQLGFNDSAWEQGEGGIGYGESEYTQTELTDMRGNYSTAYIRKKFTVADPAALGRLQMVMYYDDGFVCYINGVEVARAQAPDNYNHESIAEGDAREPGEPAVAELGNAADVLKAGDNIIAVVGFNITLSNSTDFLLMPFLLEQPKGQTNTATQAAMTKTGEIQDLAVYEATIPPMPSQSLIRYNVELRLTDGRSLILPHTAEPRPVESYFVYDGEIHSLLPILWIFHPTQVSILERPRSLSGMVTKELSDAYPQVYDGALVYPSRSGSKLKFLKGEEFRGERTLNLLPEVPRGGNTSGATAPLRERMGSLYFKSKNVLVPAMDWFRVIQTPNPESSPQTQQLVEQQVNERFIEKNGLDPAGDIYKLVYYSPIWEKHTNKEEGIASVNKLLSELSTNNTTQLHQVIEKRLNVEEIMNYTVLSVLLSNWDGFFNNNWMYKEPGEDGKWWIVPWDLDKIWGYTDQQFMYVEMPIDFPLYGHASVSGREPGPITGPAARDPQFYNTYLQRLRYEFDHSFTEGFLYPQFDAEEKLLLDDLALLEQQIGRTRDERRNQIRMSTETLKEFVRLRREYLKDKLPEPVSVSTWELY